MVAAFSDLHIRKVLRSETEARGVKMRDVAGSNRDIHRGNLRLLGRSQGDATLAETIGAPESRLVGMVMGRGLFFQLLEAPFHASSLRCLRSHGLGTHSGGPLGDGLINQRPHLLHLVNAHEHIHLGHQLGQLVTITLRHAPGHDESLTPTRGFAQGAVLQNGIHRLLLCGVDEGTGVDDHRVGLGRIVDDLDAFSEERSEHDLGVHQVFGASEGNESHTAGTGDRFFRRSRRLAHRTRSLAVQLKDQQSHRIFCRSIPWARSLALILPLIDPFEDRESCFLGIGGRQGLQVMGRAETGDHLADGFATGRASGQFGRGYGSPEGELTTAGGAVAVTKFVFVQGHDALEGT